MFVLICSTLYPICVDDLWERLYTFIVAGPDHFSIKPLDTQAFPDAVSVINAYLDVWPYARPLGHGLVTYWQSLASFQPEHFWVAYRDGIAQACLHGEVVAAQGLMHIHLLALRPGAMEMAIALLVKAEETARAQGLKQLVGPGWAAVRFYGGYVLGNEPYHPHWAVEATEAP